jgi:hypothetical protein
MASIGERVAAVQAGRDQYLAANNAGHNQDADGEIQLIQQGIAEQQARIDAYEQQIAPDPPTLVSARAALDAAQDSEAKAQVEYVDNLNLLASARELTDAQDHVAQLRTAAEAARADLEALRDKANDVVQLQPPDDAAAQLIYEPDKRHWYMVGALGGLAALFAGPIWMGLKESRPQAPFASIAAANDRADADADEFDRMHSLHNEGHPATM